MNDQVQELPVGEGQRLRKLYRDKVIYVSEGNGVNYVVPEEVEPGTELRSDGKVAELDRNIVEQHITRPFLKDGKIEGVAPKIRVQAFEIPREEWSVRKWKIFPALASATMNALLDIVVEYDGSRSMLRFFVEELEEKVHVWCVLMVWGGR